MVDDSFSTKEGKLSKDFMEDDGKYAARLEAEKARRLAALKKQYATPQEVIADAKAKYNDPTTPPEVKRQIAEHLKSVGVEITQ